MVAFITVLCFICLVVIEYIAQKYKFVMISSLDKAFCIVCFFHGFYKLVEMVIDK